MLTRYWQRCVLDCCRPHDLHHSQSDTFQQAASSSDANSSSVPVGFDDLPPPPPPPIYEDEEVPPSRPAALRNLPVDTLMTGAGTGTSKSTTSAASFTLTSNASVLSSQTDESEEESGSRRRVRSLLCTVWHKSASAMLKCHWLKVSRKICMNTEQHTAGWSICFSRRIDLRRC